MPKYKITDNQTGKTVTISGDSPPTEQEAEQIFADAGLRTQSQEPQQKGLLDSVLGMAQGAGNFIAPKVTAAVNASANTYGMAKDYIDYNLASDPAQKQEEAKSYTQRQQAANEALKQFGFDSNKQGNQFDLVKYLRGVTAGGGELATLATPVKGNVGARLVANAVPGVTNAIGEGKGVADTVKSGILSSLLGTGSEYATKGVGKAVKKGGELLAKKGENLGVRRFGLTKLDKGKFKREFGETVGDFAKKYGLIGEDVSAAQTVHDTLQDSFDDIAKKSGLQVDVEDLVKRLNDKATEMANDELPGVQSKAAIIKQYAENISNKYSEVQNVDIGKVSALRGKADKLAKFDKTGEAADAYKTIRDILQGKVRDTADNANLTGVEGKDLTQLGKSLNQLKTFLKTAEVRDPELSSIKPLGLMKTMAGGGGATAGAVLGGPLGLILGAALGMTTEEVANNPKTMELLSKALMNTGNAAKNSNLPKFLEDFIMKSAQMGGVKFGTLL